MKGHWRVSPRKRSESYSFDSKCQFFLPDTLKVTETTIFQPLKVTTSIPVGSSMGVPHPSRDAILVSWVCNCDHTSIVAVWSWLHISNPYPLVPVSYWIRRIDNDQSLNGKGRSTLVKEKIFLSPSVFSLNREPILWYLCSTKWQKHILFVCSRYFFCLLLRMFENYCNSVYRPNTLRLHVHVRTESANCSFFLW